MTSDDGHLLEVKDLRVTFDTPDGPLHAVNGANLQLQRGEMLGLLGESGCGKSATAKTIMGILPTPPGRIVSGSVMFKGENVLEFSASKRRRLMGRELGWIPQDPLSSLNPTFRIGRQLTETLRRHLPLNRSEAQKKAVDLLGSVGLPRPEQLMRVYPHELSGGMRQRVLIAIAIAPDPSVLIADEPTTALDVTVQAEIMSLLKAIQSERHTGMIFITHDCALAGAVTDRVAIMYAGSIVESGPSERVFDHPGHPYTVGLLKATPSLAVGRSLYTIPGTPPKLMDEPRSCSFADRCEISREQCFVEVPEPVSVGPDQFSACFEAAATAAQPSIIETFLSGRRDQGVGAPDAQRPLILSGVGLSKVFGFKKSLIGRGRGPGVVAVDDVDVELRKGETLCIVGESGSGKSTLARVLLGLEMPNAGSVHYQGEQIVGVDQPMPRMLRREIQFVAQDPYSSLDRRMRVGKIVAEGWRVHRGIVDPDEQDAAAEDLLAKVGITSPNVLRRLPHEFSGGQRQRIAIARALALDPSVIILDEPVSSLDVSVQAQVIELLKEVQEAQDISYAFITHDLSIVEVFATNVIVMQAGKIVEAGTSDQVLNDPQHDYTKRLLASSPRWEASGRAVIKL